MWKLKWVLLPAVSVRMHVGSHALVWAASAHRHHDSMSQEHLYRSSCALQHCSNLRSGSTLTFICAFCGHPP